VDTNTGSGFRRWASCALAALDAIALACVIYNAPWGMNATSQVQGEYAWLAKPFTIAIDLAWNGIALAFVVAVGYAIARELRGGWKPSRALAIAASLPLLVCVALAAWKVHHDLARIFAVIALPDRAVVFDALAYPDAMGESTAARLAWIVVAIYLGEKYLLRWWNVWWPVSIIALAALAWPIVVALHGESRQKDWVAAQQWRVIGDEKTWLQSLQACNALGPGWRLARPQELPLFVASEPEALHGTRGKLWTAATSELGRAAVVIDPQPRLRGSWRSNETPHRDHSVCELDARRSVPPPDWFGRMRPRICEGGFLSEAMFVSTEQRIAYIRGSRATPTGSEYIAAETTAGAVCIKPAGEPLKSRRRVYPKQEEYPSADAFLERMRAVCNPRQGGSDAAACAVFGGQEPATKATAG
jgi:hypothetical protein